MDIPSRPLTADELDRLEATGEIDSVSPIMGLEPEPADTVIMFYAGVEQATAVIALNPLEQAWKVDSSVIVDWPDAVLELASETMEQFAMTQPDREVQILGPGGMMVGESMTPDSWPEAPQ